MAKQTVLLLGATGNTGESILTALLEDRESFHVEALVRPSSTNKPEVKELADRGVPLRVVDIGGPLEQLLDVLAGVDVLISTIDYVSQRVQIQLATAAKQAGVKRFVPCAFISVAPPGGVMPLRDVKEEVYQHIRKLYLPYTIIDVGWWHQIAFSMLPSGRVDYAALMKPLNHVHAGGDTPSMLMDLRDIGRYVALIIKDPRTLNKFVVMYSDVLCENEIFAIMEEMSGEKIERKHLSVSADDMAAARARHAAALEANPHDGRAGMLAGFEAYVYSINVRGDNTPAYAAYLGYLDANELYPGFRPARFRSFVAELLDGKIPRAYKNWADQSFFPLQYD